MSNSSSKPNTLSVLHLVTTQRPFFDQQLQILRNKNINCDVISVPGKHRVSEETIKTRSYYDYLRFYPSVLKKCFGSYDLIHANHGLTAPFALSQPRLPVVVSLWGNEATGRFGWFIERCSRLSDETIVMSRQMEQTLGHDAHIIPHGVDLSLFKPIPQSEAITHVGWDAETKHVLFPYAPSRNEKNYPLAKQVVERAQDKVSTPIQLQTVHGIDHEQMPFYYNSADALLLTSTREGFPNSVKEGLACNLPVVSTDVGGVPERLEDISHSYVGNTEAELTEYLIRALESGKRSDGREHVRDLSLGQMAEDTISVYEKALTEN